MNIYKLCEKGISINLIHKLIEKDVSPEDIKNDSSILFKVFNKKSTHIPRIINALNNISLYDNTHSIFELSELEISINVVERLHKNGMTFDRLINSNINDVKKMARVSVETAVKVKNAALQISNQDTIALKKIQKDMINNTISKVE